MKYYKKPDILFLTPHMTPAVLCQSIYGESGRAGKDPTQEFDYDL